MIDSLQKLFKLRQDIPDKNSLTEKPEDLVAAILLEAAIIDGDFAESERTAITKLLRKRFVIDDGDLDLLIERARHETENTVDLYAISQRVTKVFNYDERLELVEMLWEVVHADGIIEDFESNIMRRLAGLLHVSDRESGNAKKRVLKKYSV
jgi:Uncharacterized protein conserved in bacteria